MEVEKEDDASVSNAIANKKIMSSNEEGTGKLLAF